MTLFARLWRFATMICILLLLTAFWSWLQFDATDARQAGQDPICEGFVSDSLPFVDLIPSIDGSEFIVESYGETSGEEIIAEIGVTTADGGGTSDNVSWTPINPTKFYTRTFEGMPITDTLTGLLTITVGAEQKSTDFVRYKVRQNETPTLMFPASNPDSVFALTLLSTNTLPGDFYLNLMHTLTPPVPAPENACFVGQLYDIQAGNNTPRADQAMELTLSYEDIGIADLDPDRLVLVAWNRTAGSTSWIPVLDQAIDAGNGTLSAAIEQFTTYALLLTTDDGALHSAWEDEFDNADRLDLANGNVVNVTLGNQGGDNALILVDPTLEGYAISTPISLPTTSATWGPLSYRIANQSATTITIDVLAADQSLLLENVANNLDLAKSLSAGHTVILLRASLKSASAEQSPALFAWRVEWSLPAPTPTPTATESPTPEPTLTPTATPTVTPTDASQQTIYLPSIRG